MRLRIPMCIAAGAAGLVCASACSSTPTGIGIGGGSSSGVASSSGVVTVTDGAVVGNGGKGAGGSSGGFPMGDQGPNSTGCDTMGSNSDCQVCCNTQAPDDDQGVNEGFDAYFDALYYCVCGTTGANGVCSTVCASELCAGTYPAEGDACDTCLQNADLDPDGGNGPCTAAVETACNENIDCQGWSTCVNGCPP